MTLYALIFVLWLLLGFGFAHAMRRRPHNGRCETCGAPCETPECDECMMARQW